MLRMADKVLSGGRPRPKYRAMATGLQFSLRALRALRAPEPSGAMRRQLSLKAAFCVAHGMGFGFRQEVTSLGVGAWDSDWCNADPPSSRSSWLNR